MEELNVAIALIGSFIIGSIPTGYIIAKSKGVNIREKGSGNIGATNVFRVIGKKEGILTLLMDVAKGTFSVWLMKLVFNNSELAIYAAAAGAVLGHDFSLFLRFKGGKGVATTYGATLLIAPYASICGMILWIFILLTTKYSSLSALTSFTVSVVVCFLLYKNPATHYLMVGLWVLMLWKHRENIKRLYMRKENRLNI